MTSIQAVYVRGHEDRAEPKAHVVYRIEIQASVRSWMMWRRYSEFTDLHTELTKSTGAAPPAPLPPKHALSIFKSRDNAALVEERRSGLEAYLRAIVGAPDERWRDATAFKAFLGVPMGKAGVGPGAGGPGAKVEFTSAAWLDEHLALQARVRDVRADVNKRDALADRGDAGGAHGANVSAKKTLAAILTRVRVLAEGLHTLAMRGLAEGELQRRTDMVARLQDDCEKLGRMVTVARLTSTAGAAMTAADRNPAPASDRAALLGTAPTFDNKPGRRFGAPAVPQETEETRPLEDTGILQLQQLKMQQQDANLSQLTTILQRQRQLGVAIGQEIAEHIEILDDLDHEVDRVGGNLSKAKTQMNRLG